MENNDLSDEQIEDYMSDLFIPHLIDMAKRGDLHSARTLVQEMRYSIAKRRPLPETLQQYIIEALNLIVDKYESADIALHLKNRRGVSKHPVYYRNLRITNKVAKLIKDGLKPNDAYEEVSRSKHEWEGCAPVSLSPKMIKEIYLMYKRPTK